MCLFTDTLGDVNGVSRFVQAMGDEALGAGRELHIITSTRFECPDRPNVHNLRPLLSVPMPGYSALDVVWPDGAALARLAEALNPDVVHVSTPGPVGWAGRRWALRRGAPLVGTYHTDFPAYVEHLLDDRVLTWTCGRAMRRFYAPFARVFSRSADYGAALGRLGIPSGRVERLPPGIDLGEFGARNRDHSGSLWRGVPGARSESLKVLYVGRVSVEKNLRFLVHVWPRVLGAMGFSGIDTQLVIVGDGPYRREMAGQLCGPGVVFAGFRHGEELARLYASSDLFVFPSATDTLGQAVLEAQASGLTAIVSDRGGPADLVDHERTGFVLPVSPSGKAARAWAAMITRLLSDAPLRRSLGGQGAVKVAAMPIRATFERFWEVHEEVKG